MTPEDRVRFLIERAMPLRELSAEARREKAIRHGHISTLHVWWARRPLVVARAAVLGALLTDEADIAPDFVQNLCRWEVHDGDETGGRSLLNEARALVRQRFGSTPPKVLDSFAGGGSIPLEALRLGAQAFAVEYNPVAYLILKATIEYPQRYRQSLVEEVQRWGAWVLEQARRELAAFYPSVGRETPIAYIWSRTIRCPNPSCGAEIPLFRQFWLARKGARREIALAPVVDRERRCVNFRIVQRQGDSWQVIDDSSERDKGRGIGGEERGTRDEGRGMRDEAPLLSLTPHPSPLIPNSFDPSKGTVSRGHAVCLVCNTSVRDSYVKAEAQADRMGHRLVAVVTTRGRGHGRNYRLATEEDLAAFRKAEQALQNLLQTPSPWAFGLSWVPEEEVEQIKKRPLPVWLDDLYLYNMPRWCDVFNPRQLLALCTFGKWVREAYRQILRQSDDPDFAKAVATYLALAFDKLAELASVLTPWEPDVQCARHVFARHAITMVWDYAETNPLANSSGGWINTVFKMLEGLRLSVTKAREPSVYHGSATALPFPDKHFDAVVIDPPYADNVPYADLSDFFYVWLRRTVGDLYPEAFGTELVPKEEEAVVNPARFGGGKKGEAVARSHYQRLMQKSFAEIYRVLQPDGMAVVMFTHRSTEAWERLMLSLLEAGLYPTASWPVHTEMEASTHQRGKGAIQSTILMACRRRPENAGVGWYAQVRDDLERVIRERLEAFWRAGIRGADFFVSAIGPAVGVFGKYRKVMHPDGREVTVSDLLDEARSLVTRFALEQLRLSTLDAPTRFYVLYRWAYGGAELSFDEANKLAKSVGAELDALAGEHHLVERRQDKVQTPAFARRFQNLDFCKRLQQALDDGQLPQLPEIDQVHLLLYLWRKGERENISAVLGRAGVMSEDHPLWRTAQALLEVQQNDQKADEIGEEVTVLAQLLGSKRGLLREVEQTHTNALQLQFFDDTVTPRRRRR